MRSSPSKRSMVLALAVAVTGALALTGIVSAVASGHHLRTAPASIPTAPPVKTQ